MLGPTELRFNVFIKLTFLTSVRAFPLDRTAFFCRVCLVVLRAHLYFARARISLRTSRRPPILETVSRSLSAIFLAASFNELTTPSTESGENLALPSSALFLTPAPLLKLPRPTRAFASATRPDVNRPRFWDCFPLAAELSFPFRPNEKEGKPIGLPTLPSFALLSELPLLKPPRPTRAFASATRPDVNRPRF